jgi:hypothetical protein
VLQGSISYYKIHLLHNLFKRGTKGYCNHHSFGPSTFYPTEAGRQGCNKAQRFFYTQSSKITRLVKKVQTFQPKVRDSLQQAKQHHFSSKASRSPRFRFSNRFPLSPENSTQWIPLLPKEGGLIQVDIGGHPPSPTGPKHVSGNFGNLLFLAVFNFRGHFEALNNVF